MKITVFFMEEKILCFTVAQHTLLVSVQPVSDGYEVSLTVNGRRVEEVTEHYSGKDYALLAYRMTADRVRNLAKRCGDLDEVMGYLVGRKRVVCA